VSPFSLTCYLTQHNAVKWVKNFFGVKDVNAARQRLDRVMKEECQTVAALTPGLADGVAKDIVKFVDGEQITWPEMLRLLSTLLSSTRGQCIR